MTQNYHAVATVHGMYLSVSGAAPDSTSLFQTGVKVVSEKILPLQKGGFRCDFSRCHVLYFLNEL